jgi:hypothetical protein
MKKVAKKKNVLCKVFVSGCFGWVVELRDGGELPDWPAAR